MRRDNKDSIWADADLRREILAMMVWDRQFMRRCGDQITGEDFETGGKSRDALAVVVAGLATEFWRKNHVPISSSLSVAIKHWARDAGIGTEKRDELRKYARRLRRNYHPDRSDVVQKEVWSFKRKIVRIRAIRELATSEQAGELTDDRMLQVLRDVADGWEGESIVDWPSGLTRRSERRTARQYERAPQTMIEPLDRMVRSIGRGHLGLWLAPPKRGKSLVFVWQSVAYVFQGLNVLLFALEDPLTNTEDRLDACVSEVEMNFLAYEEPRVKKRVTRWADMIRTRLRIFDGTEGDVTVSKIEAVWERERARGFEADVILVDYDDELRPTIKRRERRQEFADIYRDLRRLASRKQILVWTASQTTRTAEEKDIIDGQDVAEDISKVRKATMAVGIGTCKDWNGEKGSAGNAKTLFVAYHRLDRQKLACRIWSNPSKGLFYDREKTAEWERRDERLRNETEVVE